MRQYYLHFSVVTMRAVGEPAPRSTAVLAPHRTVFPTVSTTPAPAKRTPLIRAPVRSPRILQPLGSPREPPTTKVPERDSSPLISDIHVSCTPTSYTAVVAAPGARQGSLFYAIDSSLVLRVSNAAEPEVRAVHQYAVEALRVAVHSYPSLQAPRIEYKFLGERFLGCAPVHFWVAISGGQGWIRIDDPLISSPTLAVLDREPFSMAELRAARGFARFTKLPPDADAGTASARLMRDGLFLIEMRRRPPGEQPTVVDGSGGQTQSAEANAPASESQS